MYLGTSICYDCVIMIEQFLVVLLTVTTGVILFIVTCVLPVAGIMSLVEKRKFFFSVATLILWISVIMFIGEIKK